MGFDIIEDFPFMLRLSKHSEPFFSDLLDRPQPAHAAWRNLPNCRAMKALIFS